MSTNLFRLSLATILGGAALFWGGQLPFDRQSLVSTAEARVGRPLTPMSYAGVARRTTRRAGAVGAAGAVTAGAYYAAPRACSQVADAYGRIVTVCP
ncbi:hypothetical protein [Bradyrhizobium ottawaense]|uniref:hypothetical protein n=1 Tax=Bradyrhizobium ottawaense TaxID=931866 RepID=UPI003D321F82